MLIVPDFGEFCKSIIGAVAASLSGIVPRPRASDEGYSTALRAQGVSDIRICVLSGIGRSDVRLLEPLERRESLVVFDRGLKEVHYVLMFLILWTIAWYIEGREASRVFRKFVSPEPRII